MAEKTAAQKMFIKPGYSVLPINPPENLEALLGGWPDGVRVLTAPGEPADFILAFIENRQQLEAVLPGLEGQLKPGGLLWIAYHKGTSRVKTDIHRDSINAYAQMLGWVGVAMVAVDDDWATLRLKLAG